MCRGQDLADEAVAGDLRRHAGPEPFVFPSLVDRKAINQNLARLTYTEGVDSRWNQPTAVFCFDRHHPAPLDHAELSMHREDQIVVGAWSERCFALRVRGAEPVQQLARFAQKAQEGDALFAGLFLEKSRTHRFTGVIVALQSELQPEHLAAISAAQTEWEQRILLLARSRLDELYDLYSDAQAQGNRNAQLPGFLWPVWENHQIGGSVLYRVNPSRESRFKSGGPYSFEQLADWVLAEQKVPLVPYGQAA